MGRLYKISRGKVHAKGQVPVDLAAWCRRESVKGGGREALNGGVGAMPKTESRSGRFRRPSHG